MLSYTTGKIHNTRKFYLATKLPQIVKMHVFHIWTQITGFKKIVLFFLFFFFDIVQRFLLTFFVFNLTLNVTWWYVK